MKILKKTLLATGLMAVAMSANAEFTTPTQAETFSGKAGNSSTGVGIDPFIFDMFDSSLGDLTGVFLQYDFNIANGSIGADNVTNQEVSGSAELGGSLNLDMSSVSQYLTLSPMTLSQTAMFTLASDPDMTTGGTGADVFSMPGGSYSEDSGLISLTNEFLTADFMGQSGDTFTVDFSTFAINNINTDGGVQGFFNAVDTTLNMSIYYTYEEFQEDPSLTDVPTPLLGGFGLALLGLGALTRRRR